MTALTSSELAQQQLEQATQQRPKKKAKPVRMSKSSGIQYNAKLQKMVEAISKDIRNEVAPTVRGLESQYIADAWIDDIGAVLQRLRDKWTGPAAIQLMEQLAGQFVRSANNTNRNKFNQSMRSIGLDIYGDSPELDDYLAAAASDNARLIKSIPEQYLTQVESIVIGNMRSGLRPGAIEKALSDQFGVTQRRARFIARDQTAKINGELSKQRQQNSGFEYFEWDDSDDERVRERHEEIANKVTAYGKGIYRWDNPPLSDKGVPIIPGQDYGCRCVARPVSNAEVMENQKAGKTRPGVYR